MLRLSIITINFNNCDGLLKTMQSVLTQTFSNLEYIIIDGGSTDGSRELIEKHSKEIDFWISEKDNGIYHAMNKGIKNSTGDYLLFLNSGDFLISSDIIQKALSEFNNEDIIYGNLLIDGAPDKYPDTLSFHYFYRHGTLPHQAAFIKKELFEKFGYYDEQNKICSDTIFFIKVLCKYNVVYKHIPIAISQINMHGISSQPKSWPIIEKEIHQSIEKEFPLFVEDYKKLNALTGVIKRSRLLNTMKKVGLLKHINI